MPQGKGTYGHKVGRPPKKYPLGGELNGPSHDNGGIPIEAEGGEFVIKKDSVNASTLDMLEYVNQHGDLPMSDARKRRK
tara:strand:+ start:213 stop:449 length:237 start_codon:yes stop_codon:yes gene_type:complete